MMKDIQLTGLTGASGARYVNVSSDDNSACIPLARFTHDERGIKSSLAEAGIPIIGSARWNKFINAVSELRSFPPATVIETVGWNGEAFALPDGTVISPPGAGPAYLSIEKQRNKCSASGNFKEWKSGVASLLKDQPFATFILMFAFVAPILGLSDRVGNIGFEIVGAKGTGKSTLQFLTSSIFGGVDQSTGGHYWVTLDTTYNALEDAMKLHSDLALIMDEANLLAADASSKVRSEIFKALAFKLGSGSVKARLGSRVAHDYRLGFLISSNEPLASLLNQGNEGARAAADRLITLRIGESRPFGVFDELPRGYNSSSEFALALMRAARRHHGSAIRRFLESLVQHRSADEGEVKKRIRRYVRKFQNRVNTDFNDGSAVRIAEAFGLVYAAGKMAQRYGVLPKTFNPKAAAAFCYELHRTCSKGEQVQFRDQLDSVLRSEMTLQLRKSKDFRSTALAFVQRRNGRSELLIPPNHIRRVFPDWGNIKNSKEVASLMRRDGDHLTVKRKLGPGKKVRVHCFDLSTLETNLAAVGDMPRRQ
jgi:hypothetical protein